VQQDSAAVPGQGGLRRGLFQGSLAGVRRGRPDAHGQPLRRVDVQNARDDVGARGVYGPRGGLYGVECLQVSGLDVSAPLQERLDRAASFLSLEPGWDSYRAPSVSKAAVGAASDVLREVWSRHGDLTGMGVFPTLDGGVLLEWRVNNRMVFFEAYRDGRLTWQGDSDCDEEREADPPGIGPVVDWMTGTGAKP